jgi:glycolate oxidase FAD binding subunit
VAWNKDIPAAALPCDRSPTMPTMTNVDSLPITELVEPATIEELRSAVRSAVERDLAIYPLGGLTSLDFGLVPQRTGIGLSLGRLSQVIDYPARDMTITIQAGITMDALARTLAKEGQCVPLDVPEPARGTVGGVVATHPVGPRCYSAGTIRDYVIGIHAVDAQGEIFKAGGRVVKNVAGYDFCKLLTGSLGTLAIITQLTLKLRPIPEQSALMSSPVPTWTEAEERLAAMVHSQTAPSAIELVAGDAWLNDPIVCELAPCDRNAACHLVVGLDGTQEEVSWMTKQLASEWTSQSASPIQTVSGDDARRLWERLSEFPAEDKTDAVLRANVVPGKTTWMIQAIQKANPGCHVLSHAGNGVIFARLRGLAGAELASVLIGRLQPAATSALGNIVVLAQPGGTEMTRQAVWGGIDAPYGLMRQIKAQFDPADRLNPGRFVY